MAQQNKLQQLPQSDLDWYCAYHRLDTPIDDGEGNIIRPYVIAVLNLDTETVLGIELVSDRPEPAKVYELLETAMLNPMPSSQKKPHRPKRILFAAPELAQSLALLLGQMDITAVYEKIEGMMESLSDELEESLAVAPPLGLLSIPGVTPKQIGALFAAAADFYRAAPWEQLSNLQPLAVELQPEGRQAFVLLMGYGGMEYGIVLYDRWEALLASFEPTNDPLSMLPPGGLQTLTYDEADSLPEEDLKAIKRYKWRIANKQAYPFPVNFTSQGLQRPDLETLALYEALMRAIPQFVQETLQMDESKTDFLPAAETYRLEGIRGPVEVRLAYPAGDLPEEFGFFLDPLEGSEDFEEDDPFENEDQEDFSYDLRALEGDMARALQNLTGESDDPALAQAQELVYEAFDTSDPEQRVQLAFQALEISPNCADAYVLLAEENAESLEEASAYYRQGVEAGERALGQEYFAENAGHFWGLLETRPYMRARSGLADCLWAQNKPQDARAHYQELLRLNPNDNQGVRYQLLALLLEMKLYPEARTLLEQYPEDYSIFWLYNQALLAFQAEGAGPKANQALAAARAYNPYAPAYLTGEKRIPVRAPNWYKSGEKSEAMAYTVDHLTTWRRMPGAIDWLKSQAQAGDEEPTKKTKRGRRGKR